MTFIVLDESKDVLLEVYAPWFGHWQSLETEYNKLGEALKNISSIVIAKMHGTKNEHERLKIEGYPTILFFLAGDKSAEPISLDTERTAASFIKFMKQHATHPFEAPMSSSPSPNLTTTLRKSTKNLKVKTAMMKVEKTKVNLMKKVRKRGRKRLTSTKQLPLKILRTSRMNFRIATQRYMH
nr:protein disulfide isomerase-like 1-4 [Physcomitrium patens]|eukprot:XP_024403873.1 protein disulfide isomerase-like 1-4 [Physcomitrella patens]